MADLPASWNLKKKKRDDGKLDIIGKTDAGAEYRVRTTDTPEVTEKDLRELKAADRETYSNREEGVREFVKSLCPPEDKTSASMVEQCMGFDDSEWISAAEPIIHAGFERKGATLGSTWTYRQGFDQWIRTVKESN